MGDRLLCTSVVLEGLSPSNPLPPGQAYIPTSRDDCRNQELVGKMDFSQGQSGIMVFLLINAKVT